MNNELKLSIAIAMAENLWMKGLISDDEIAKIRLKLAEKLK